MVSHVPGYGHLEYLVLGLSCGSHHSPYKFDRVFKLLLIGIEMGFTILNV